MTRKGFKRSRLERLFEAHIVNDGLPPFEIEFPTGVGRSRFDFAWPLLKIAVEIEGGTWVGGRHSRGAGFQSDCEKYNAATLEGWAIYRFTGDDVEKGNARRMTKLAIERELRRCEK